MFGLLFCFLWFAYAQECETFIRTKMSYFQSRRDCPMFYPNGQVWGSGYGSNVCHANNIGGCHQEIQMFLQQVKIYCREQDPFLPTFGYRCSQLNQSYQPAFNRWCQGRIPNLNNGLWNGSYYNGSIWGQHCVTGEAHAQCAQAIALVEQLEIPSLYRNDYPWANPSMASSYCRHDSRRLLLNYVQSVQAACSNVMHCGLMIQDPNETFFGYLGMTLGQYHRTHSLLYQATCLQNQGNYCFNQRTLLGNGYSRCNDPCTAQRFNMIAPMRNYGMQFHRHFYQTHCESIRQSCGATFLSSLQSTLNDSENEESNAFTLQWSLSFICMLFILFFQL
jgi:hypothetical protein